MAKIKVTGSTMTLTLGIPTEKVQTLAKYNPDALTLYKTEGTAKKPICAVKYFEHGNASSVSGSGVMFTDSNSAGYPQISIDLGCTPVEAPTLVKEQFSKLVLNLRQLEAQILAEHTALEDMFEAVEDDIQVDAENA